MHMSRNHGHGFTGLHKERHKSALDCEIIRYQGTIGIRGMVQQDEDAADVRPLFKALKLLRPHQRICLRHCATGSRRAFKIKPRPQRPVGSQAQWHTLEV